MSVVFWLLLFAGPLYVAYVAVESFISNVERRRQRRNAPRLFIPTAEEAAAYRAWTPGDYSHLGWPAIEEGRDA